ncbi:MAG: Glycoside hydrolase family 3 domain protein [candidate division TM6 bacterium GW2011_GWE2_41_16]|nr:MAG: Glycoside hydrolase family 3 domain protein [candidate division TM6 bacterium GW2011_GWE2_41_16]
MTLAGQRAEPLITGFGLQVYCILHFPNGTVTTTQKLKKQYREKQMKNSWKVICTAFVCGIFQLTISATKLTDEQLINCINQMILIGASGNTLIKNSLLEQELKKGVGGFMLLPCNIATPQQVKLFVQEIKSASRIPFFIAVDAEGGTVERLTPAKGFIEIPSAKTLGQDRSLENTKKYAEILAQQLNDLGINMNMAPVLDVDINPDNPIIGKRERSFSADPEIVTNNARVCINIHKAHSIVPIAKHFPGHGSSKKDSHVDLPDITDTYCIEKELYPYAKLQDEQLLDVVMTAHLMNKSIDPVYPATLSHTTLTGILRTEIGFDGVIISDDMLMGAIHEHFGFENAIIQAINAGCDIVLISKLTSTTCVHSINDTSDIMPVQKLPADTCTNTVAFARMVIFNAVKTGAIDEQRIVKAHERIMRLKKVYGIIK